MIRYKTQFKNLIKFLIFYIKNSVRHILKITKNTHYIKHETEINESYHRLLIDPSSKTFRQYIVKKYDNNHEGNKLDWVDGLDNKIELIKYSNNNLKVTLDSGLVLVDNKIHVDKSDPLPTKHYNKARVFNYKLPIFISRKTYYLEKAIIITGPFHYNYYHWILDILPKFKILQELFEVNEVVPVLLPKTTKNFQTESLSIANKELFNDRLTFYYCGDNLTYSISELTIIPLMSRTSEISRLKLDYLHKIFKKYYNEKSLAKKKTYLLRKNTSNKREILNEKELAQELIKLNFNIIDLSKLTIKEQAKVISDSEIIVSPHGASLTNLIFSKQRITLIEIFHESYINPVFQTICKEKNINYHSYIVRSKAINKNYSIEVKNFIRYLNDIVEEYNYA